MNNLLVSNSKIIEYFCSFLLKAVFLGIICSVLINNYGMLKSSSYGARYPFTIYGILSVPGTAPEIGARKSAGADFSQVYFSSKALRHSDSAYFPENITYRNPFDNLSGLPPLTNWVYVPLSYLPYFYALLFHTWISVLIFLFSSAWLLHYFDLKKHIVRVLALCSAFYILTPIGVTHYERGQFDLLVSISIILIFASLYSKGSGVLKAFSCGFVGALKWTSFPLLGCSALFGLIVKKNEGRKLFGLILLVIAILTLGFHESIVEYWKVIEHFDLNARPTGIAFQHFLPWILVKTAPLIITMVLIAFVKLRADSCDILRAVSLPFLISLVITSNCYATVSYEYHTVSLLSIIPCFVVWIEKNDSIAISVKIATTFLFALLLVSGFRIFLPTTIVSSENLAFIFLMFAICFFIICLYILHDTNKSIKTKI